MIMWTQVDNGSNTSRAIAREGTYYKGKKPVGVPVPSQPDITSLQEQDARFLVKQKYAALFNVPGTGKTYTALRALQFIDPSPTLIKSHGGRRVRCMLLIPKNLVTSWVGHALALCPDWKIVHIYSGSCKIPDDFNILIVSYSLLSTQSSMVDKLRNLQVDCVILDEMHYLANKDANRTQVVYGNQCCGEGAIISEVPYVWGLTGTPTPSHADGLWPHLHALAPDLLTAYRALKYSDFIAQFCTVKTELITTPRGYKKRVSRVVGSRNHRILKELLYKGRFAVRRTNVVGMPTTRHLTVDIEVNRPSELYKHALRELAQVEASTGEHDGRLSAAHRLLGLEKAAHMADLLHKLVQEGKSVFVPYQHVAVMRNILGELKASGIRADYIGGDTSSKVRDTLIQEFNTGELQVLLGQFQAICTGANLQGFASTVLMAERTFSNATNEQAFKRVARLGQSNRVDVIWPRLPDDLVEEILDRVTARKMELQVTAID